MATWEAAQPARDEIHRFPPGDKPNNLSTQLTQKLPCGYGSKLNHQGTAGFSPCFHLPGYFGHLFLTHGHVAVGSRMDAVRKEIARCQPQSPKSLSGSLPNDRSPKHACSDSKAAFSLLTLESASTLEAVPVRMSRHSKETQGQQSQRYAIPWWLPAIRFLSLLAF